jgi:hypothetical protein
MHQPLALAEPAVRLSGDSCHYSSNTTSRTTWEVPAAKGHPLHPLVLSS